MNVTLTKKLFGFTMVDVEERKTIYRECENLSVFQKAFLQVLGDTIRPYETRISGAFWCGSIYMWKGGGVYLAKSGDAMYFDEKSNTLARLVYTHLSIPILESERKLRYKTI